MRDVRFSSACAAILMMAVAGRGSFGAHAGRQVLVLDEQWKFSGMQSADIAGRRRRGSVMRSGGC